MSDESHPEDPAGAPEVPGAPAAQPWNPAPWATAPPDGWTSISTDPLGTGPIVTEELGVEDLSGGESPRRKRRWLRRTLMSLVVLVTITGLAWGSLAYVDHRREERERKAEVARVAAEKKATALYVAAVHPLALRVFDAVQPLQDVYDAFAHPRPGLVSARDDVIQHGGALRDLKGLKLQLDRLQPPPVYGDQVSGLAPGLQSLVAAVLELERTSHDRPDSHNYIRAYGPAFQALLDAEIRWADAVSVIDPEGLWPLPDEKRAQARGRNVPTAASFIMRSDIACGQANAALEFEDFKHPEKVVLNTFPKVSKEIRALVVQLRAVRQPTTKRAFRHRMEIGWSASVDVAKQFEAIAAAYKRRDVVAYDRSYKRLLEAIEQMEDLGRAYTSQGVSMCAGFFGADAGKSSGGSSTTA